MHSELYTVLFHWHAWSLWTEFIFSLYCPFIFLCLISFRILLFSLVLFIFSSCFFAFLFLLFFFFFQKEIDIEKVFKQQFGQQFNLDRKDSSVPLHYHNSKLCPTLQNYSYWEVQYGYYFETKLYRWLVEWQMTNESCLQLNNKRKNIHDVTLKYYMYNN